MSRETRFPPENLGANYVVVDVPPELTERRQIIRCRCFVLPRKPTDPDTLFERTPSDERFASMRRTLKSLRRSPPEGATHLVLGDSAVQCNVAVGYARRLNAVKILDTIRLQWMCSATESEAVNS